MLHSMHNKRPQLSEQMEIKTRNSGCIKSWLPFAMGKSCEARWKACDKKKSSDQVFSISTEISSNVIRLLFDVMSEVTPYR